MNKKRLFVLAVAFALSVSIVLTGCKSNQNSGESAAGKKVYATIAPVYDFTRKIAGDKQQVEFLVKGDVHDYEPSAAEMAQLQNSSMIIYNGMELDSFVNNISDNLDIKFVDTSMGVDPVEAVDAQTHYEEEQEHYEGDGHNHGPAQKDPHIWLYPLNTKIQLANIRDALIEADKENAGYYKENYNTYADKCDELDKKFKTLSGKTIVTTHNAYGYWQAKYGINVVAMDTSGEEVSPARMKEIVDFCRQNSISVIYYEETGSDKTAAAVAAEIGGTTRALNSFEAVIDNKDDYFAIMEQNYEALK